MSNFRITGQQPLSGTIAISGRKNAALKLIAAALISDQPVTIYNLPDIADVEVMLRIIESLGASVVRSEGMVVIHASQISSSELPDDLGKKLRASLVLAGPLLARTGHAVFPHPGGDLIGKRSITPHLEAFKELGADIHYTDKHYRLEASHLVGRTIYLKEKSVTGTENLLMAAVRANGITTIRDAAEETHISNLCDLLRTMGFKIEGDGTSTITVQGNTELATLPAEVTVIPDEIELGTFVAASAITQGTVTLTNVGTLEQLFPILSKMDDFNIQYHYDESSQTLKVVPSPNLRAADIQTRPWPGFPTDLQSPFAVVATQAVGTSLIHDWMYDGRIYFVELLQKMGANTVICDPHRALISGPTPLTGNSCIAPDIRAGAALVLAALAAEGTSLIEHAELIDRGYAKLEEKLRALGATITREG